jgi:hypothetical protein
MWGNIGVGFGIPSRFISDLSACNIEFSEDFTGSYDGDTFDCYTSDSEVNGLSGGSGWVGSWACVELDRRIYGLDTFESYTSGSEVNGLSGGTEWGGNWADYTLG